MMGGTGAARAGRPTPPPLENGLKLYADRPVRRALQLTADLLALAWIGLWAAAAYALHGTVSELGGSGLLIAAAGDRVDEHMDAAAEAARRVPVAGDSLASPFSSVGDAGASLGEAGRSFQESAASAALALSALAVLLPVLLAVSVWLLPRLRWIRRAADARTAGELSPRARERLLALRALQSVRPALLAEAHPDPAAAWRADDPEAVRALASLELRRLGLEPAGS
ncbi:hypothetical protein ACFQXA_08155 [Nocardiopsis composta]